MNHTNENLHPVQTASDDFDNLRLLDVDQVCELFRIKRSWIYDAVQSGTLPVIRLGRQLRFREPELVAFLTGATTGGFKNDDAAA